MLFNSLRLFNNVDIDDVRNNLNEKDKFDILLKQTHKHLDCLVENVKMDLRNLQSINALFLNMNHLNEKLIVNLLRYNKEVSYTFLNQKIIIINDKKFFFRTNSIFF